MFLNVRFWNNTMSALWILRCGGHSGEVRQGAVERSRGVDGSFKGHFIACVAFAAAVFATLVPSAEGDNLALLSGTLRTYQRAGCEGEMVTLRCPQGTSISVQVAQYGRPPPQASSSSSSTSQPHSAVSSSTLYRPPPLCPGHSPAAAHKANATCHWPSALQYSLLQTVVEICQKKRQCKFPVTAKELSGGAAMDDICPGLSKFVEVAYKCSPFEFRSKVACEDESTELRCGSHARIAVYSASFGRTEYESIQCPQPQGVPEETCLVSYATETAMQECHGKKKCVLIANAATFGNPCKQRSQTYLKVIYTCVPRTVLKQSYQDLEEEEAWGGDEDDEGGGEEEGGEGGRGDNDEYDSYGGETDDLFRESSAFSPPPNADDDSGFGGPGKAQPSLVGKSVPGGGGPTPRQHSEVGQTSSGNHEGVYLYVFLSIGIVLVILISAVVGRLYLGRRREDRTMKKRKRGGGNCSSSSSASSSGGKEEAIGVGGECVTGDSRDVLPNGFLAPDDVGMMTEIDVDIELMVATSGAQRHVGDVVGGRGILATTSVSVPLPPPPSAPASSCPAPGPQAIAGVGQVVRYGHPRSGGSVLGVRFQCDETDPGPLSGNNQYYYA